MQHRIGTMMTVLVLGIAMLLPLGLLITLDNLDRLDLRRDQWGALTVLFRPGTSQDTVESLAAELNTRQDVSSIRLVSPSEGLAEFRSASGFGAALEMLDENPLPWLMEVSPVIGTGDTGADALLSAIQQHESVDTVQYDHKWLQRLARMLELGRALVMVLGLLFSIAVVVVVANTIRLDVATRAEEIEVLALVGAGDGFIRQPFLYSGLWYGLLGALLALLLLNIALLYLGFPLARLLDTYGTGFDLDGPGWYESGLLLLGGGLLGWLGAWTAVGRYLKQVRLSGGLGRR
jgi:cell division transport system permease protein